MSASLWDDGQLFTTTRLELFERLILSPPSGFVVTEGDEKEAAGRAAA